MGKMSTETKTYKVKYEYERVARKMCESNGKSTNNKIIHEKARIRFADYQFTATKIMEIDTNMHTHTHTPHSYTLFELNEKDNHYLVNMTMEFCAFIACIVQQIRSGVFG